MFEVINFKNCEILYRETTDESKEDLLQLRCPNGRLIDVGWYGKDNGYCLYVIENQNWECPCYRVIRQPKLEYVEHHLQKVIAFETSDFTLPVQKIMKQITDAIDSFPDYEGTFEDIVSLLAQLRDLSLSKKEAADYIEVYAMRYYDCCEGKWDFACDMLDRITGWCAPELHIWRE